MHQIGGSSASAEWRNHWPVALAAMLGYSAMGLQAYAVGPFVTSLEQSFGWSRTEIMIGLTISNAVGVLCNFGIGMVVDRLGPRRVGLTGLVVKCLAFALLGTATGSLLNWSMLWLLVALGVMLVQASIWTSAVIGRFDKGRGMAIAVALTGTSLAAAILPILASWLIVQQGWRIAMVGTGLIWLLATFPIVFFFFRGRQDDVLAEKPAAEQAPAALDTLPGYTLKEGLRTPAFWRIAAANFAFAFYTVAMAANLIPLLGTKGASPLVAAQIASLVGVVGLVARLSTGFLLDKLPPNAVATVIFLLPVLGCLLMLMDSPSYLVLAIAVAGFGITIGAEYDVVFFLMSRHLGLKSIGALLGAMLTGGAFAGVIAPMASGWIYDQTGSYDQLLIMFIIVMPLAAIMMATMGKPKRDWRASGH